MSSSHNTGTRSKLGSKREARPGVWQVRVSNDRLNGTQRVTTKTIHGNEVEADAEIVRLAMEMGKCLTTGDAMTLDVYYCGYFSPTRHATTTKANAYTERQPLSSTHCAALWTLGPG